MPALLISTTFIVSITNKTDHEKKLDSQTGSHAALLTIKFSKITPDILDRRCYLIVIRNIELKCFDLGLYTAFA